MCTWSNNRTMLCQQLACSVCRNSSCTVRSSSSRKKEECGVIARHWGRSKSVAQAFVSGKRILCLPVQLQCGHVLLLTFIFIVEPKFVRPRLSQLLTQILPLRILLTKLHPLPHQLPHAFAFHYHVHCHPLTLCKPSTLCVCPLSLFLLPLLFSDMDGSARPVPPPPPRRKTSVTAPDVAAAPSASPAKVPPPPPKRNEGAAAAATPAPAAEHAAAAKSAVPPPPPRKTGKFNA